MSRVDSLWAREPLRGQALDIALLVQRLSLSFRFVEGSVQQRSSHTQKAVDCDRRLLAQGEVFLRRDSAGKLVAKRLATS